jgi:hypothetical protein
MRRTRRIRSSMSRSSTQLNALALAAARQPPTMVSSTSPSGGTPPAARNMAGTVVTSSSSMIRGLVSPTYAARTSRTLDAVEMPTSTRATWSPAVSRPGTSMLVTGSTSLTSGNT